MPATLPSAIPPAAVEFRVPTPAPGHVTEVRAIVTTRRIDRTAAGPGLAAPAIEAHGEPVEDWAEVIKLDDRRAS